MTVNKQWSSDVTYIKMGRRNVFQVVVLDLVSRRILGWKFEETEFRAFKMRDMLARHQIIHQA